MSRATRERQARYNRIIAAPLAAFGLLAIAVAVAVVLAQPSEPPQPVKLGPLPTPTTSNAADPCGTNSAGPGCVGEPCAETGQKPGAPWGVCNGSTPTTTPTCYTFPHMDGCYRPDGPCEVGKPCVTLPQPTPSENPEGPEPQCPAHGCQPGTPGWYAYCYRHPEDGECATTPTPTTAPNLGWNVECYAHPDWERCSIPPISAGPTISPPCVPTATVSCGPGFGPRAPVWTTPTPRTFTTPTDECPPGHPTGPGWEEC